MRVSLRDPISPWAVASHLRVHVFTFADLASDGASDFAIRHFTGASAVLSAYSIIDDRLPPAVVLNQAMPRSRQASSLAHELAHIILEHKPTVAFDHVTGCRKWSREMEDEADWLGGVLLVPRQAAFEIAASGWSVQVAADNFGVSRALMQMRLNLTGAQKILRRSR